MQAAAQPQRYAASLTTTSMKADPSIKNIVVAAIQRHSMNMDVWMFTRLWDDGDSSVKEELSLACNFAIGELPILYSRLDSINWTLVTSRRIWYSVNSIVGSVVASSVNRHQAGNFKGHGGQAVETMIIHSRDSETHRCPFETGMASMGTIYAVQTLCRLASTA
jgi:hypothetical protein